MDSMNNKFKKIVESLSQEKIRKKFLNVKREAHASIQQILAIINDYDIDNLTTEQVNNLIAVNNNLNDIKRYLHLPVTESNVSQSGNIESAIQKYEKQIESLAIKLMFHYGAVSTVPLSKESWGINRHFFVQYISEDNTVEVIFEFIQIQGHSNYRVLAHIEKQYDQESISKKLKALFSLDNGFIK